MKESTGEEAKNGNELFMEILERRGETRILEEFKNTGQYTMKGHRSGWWFFVYANNYKMLSVDVPTPWGVIRVEFCLHVQAHGSDYASTIYDYLRTREDLIWGSARIRSIQKNHDLSTPVDTYSHSFYKVKEFLKYLPKECNLHDYGQPPPFRFR